MAKLDSSALEPLSTEMMLEKAPRLDKVLNGEYEEEVKETA